jgi:hypothetical protein
MIVASFSYKDENRGLRSRCAGGAVIELAEYAYLFMTESGVRFPAGTNKSRLSFVNAVF